MNKQERLIKTIAGETTDRPPAALWRHWPGDDQRAADFARATLDFQKTFDWDFIKVTPASSFCVADYGLQDVWEGHVEGTRHITKYAVNRSLDWTELRPLEPKRGALSKQVECLRLICDTTHSENIPVIQTIFSPLAQARILAGDKPLIRHIRTQSDRLHTGLNALTESTLRFIESLKQLPLAGIFYAIQHADHAVMSEDEYRIFGLPYDRKILESLPEKWWFNIAHLHGDTPMLRLCNQLPVQVMNWHTQGEVDLAQGKLLFNGAVCGGLSRNQIQFGTPTSVREQTKAALTQTNSRRFILSADCAIMTNSPLSNIRAVREAVENVAT